MTTSDALPPDQSPEPDSQSLQGRRMIVAMDLLRRMFAPLTLAVIENTKQYRMGLDREPDGSDSDSLRRPSRPAQPASGNPSNRDTFDAARRTGPRPPIDRTPAPDDKPPQPSPQPPQASVTAPQKPRQVDTNAGRWLFGKFLTGMLGKDRAARVSKRARKFIRAAKVVGKKASRTVRRKGVKGALKTAGAKAIKGAGRGVMAVAASGAGLALRGLMMAAGKVIAPFMVLSNILGSSNSGMQTFQKAAQLAAAVIAPVFLPAMIMGAAAVMAMSDMLWNEMLPVFAQWSDLFARYGIPLMVFQLRITAGLVKWMAMLANVIIDVINKFGELVGLDKIDRIDQNQEAADQDHEKAIREENERRDRRATEHLEALDRQARAEGKDKLPADHPDNPWNPSNPNNIAAEARRRADAERDQRLAARGIVDMPQPGGGKGGRDPRNPANLFKSGLNDAIASFKMSVMPKAQFSGLADAQKNAQLAALNQDPIEARMLKVLKDSVGLLDRISENTKPAGFGGVHQRKP